MTLGIQLRKAWNAMYTVHFFDLVHLMKSSLTLDIWCNVHLLCFVRSLAYISSTIYSFHILLMSGRTSKMSSLSLLILLKTSLQQLLAQKWKVPSFWSQQSFRGKSALNRIHFSWLLQIHCYSYAISLPTASHIYHHFSMLLYIISWHQHFMLFPPVAVISNVSIKCDFYIGLAIVFWSTADVFFSSEFRFDVFVLG